MCITFGSKLKQRRTTILFMFTFVYTCVAELVESSNVSPLMEKVQNFFPTNIFFSFLIIQYFVLILYLSTSVTWEESSHFLNWYIINMYWITEQCWPSRNELQVAGLHLFIINCAVIFAFILLVFLFCIKIEEKEKCTAFSCMHLFWYQCRTG